MNAGQTLIAEALGVDDVPDAAAAGTWQPWDSLGHMRIVLALEAKIDRVLSPDELVKLWDVTQVTQIIEAATAID